MRERMGNRPLYEMNDCEPNLAVVRNPNDDVGVFWDLVAEDALGRPWVYGITGNESLYHGDDLDQIWVRRWCVRNIAHPRWRWNYWRLLPKDDRDDEVTHELCTSAERVNRLWWRGALVTLQRTDGATP